MSQPPIATNDLMIDVNTARLVSQSELVANDTDPDGDPLTITSISNVQGGTATLDPVTHVITTERTGALLSFDYTIDDGQGGTATATARLAETRDDVVTVRGASNVIDFLANDFLVPRADGYAFTFSTAASTNFVTYQLLGSGLSADMFEAASYLVSGSGYGFLPVGQTLTNTVTYSVINPVTSLVDYTATVHVTLEGWAQTGGTGYDELFGGAGQDHLVGGAEASNYLAGGAGDDWYTVQAVGDSIFEAVNEGKDWVYTPLTTFVLPANVENLAFTGATTVAFLGIGNAANNRITGLNARDVLIGYAGDDTLRGGAGGDGMENTMIGGLGNDIYVVSVRGDSTIELAAEGTDTVQTAFSIYSLQANIENLSYTDHLTHAAGVGNELANILTGGTGVDSLFGREGNDSLRGGSGAANTLLGQLGDDTYVVAAVGDSVIEFADEGTDTVQTALASFVLRDHVENLTFTGTTAFLGIGASNANTITGGVEADFLSGLGGDDILTGNGGADELFGGDGNDTFRFRANDGLDRVYDFASGSDKIALLGTAFTHTATLALEQGGAPAATTADSSFLYNSTTGLLSYDADGTGAGAAVSIAVLNAGLTLTLGDFLFY